MTQSVPALSNATLPSLPDTVRKPAYNREDLQVGILHFGPGAFPRAHLFSYVEDLADQGHTDCGIIGVSLKRACTRDQMKGQDFLYTLHDKEPEGQARIIGCLKNILVGSEDPQRVINLIANPSIHTISMTVTQDGYYFNKKDGGLDFSSADIRDSLQKVDDPKATVAYLVEGLKRRMERGLEPPVILSCDNVPGNGHRLKHTMVQFAEARELPEVAEWIREKVLCPDTMVDRITPAYKEEHTDQILAEHGYTDVAPVFTEPRFSQFVIEASAKAHLPPLDKAGADFVKDVGPYDLTKIRLLNGMHMALGIVGRLQGHETADQALADPEIRAYVRNYLDEVKQTLPAIEGLNVDDYIDTLFRRVENPEMGDPLQRLARSGVSKVESRFLDPLQELIATDKPRAFVTDMVVNYIRYLQKADATDDKGGQFYIEDKAAYARPTAETPSLIERAQALNGDMSPILDHAIWGKLRGNSVFEQEVTANYAQRAGDRGHDPLQDAVVANYVNAQDSVGIRPQIG